MKTAHTAGPWRVGTPGPNGCYTIGTERGLMTAMIAHSINEADQKEQAEANARLIAAAPEMMEALGAVLDAMSNAAPADLPQALGKAYKLCHAAYSKAYGPEIKDAA